MAFSLPDKHQTTFSRAEPDNADRIIKTNVSKARCHVAALLCFCVPAMAKALVKTSESAEPGERGKPYFLWLASEAV